MAMIEPNSNLLHDYAILMDTVEKSEIPKVLSSRLNGQITFIGFSKIFLVSWTNILNNYFLIIAIKFNKKWLKTKRKY